MSRALLDPHSETLADDLRALPAITLARLFLTIPPIAGVWSINDMRRGTIVSYTRLACPPATSLGVTSREVRAIATVSRKGGVWRARVEGLFVERDDAPDGWNTSDEAKRAADEVLRAKGYVLL